MATSFAQPILQVFDDYGVILAGGLIETFEAGTTTPLATYQDLDGVVANTNPVVLDSAGRAIIRLTDNVAYKFVIMNADEEIILTLDDIVVGTTGASGSTELIIPMTFLGTPAAQGFMGAYAVVEGFTFPVDFEGARGYAATAPASDYVISIRNNGVEIGTATISAAGAYTFATTGHTPQVIDSGDVVTFIGPDVAGTAADLGMSLPGGL